MYCGRDFSAQAESESELFSFDFVNDLAEGDALDSAIWSLTIVRGADADIATRLIGGAETGPSKTFQRIAGLRRGVRYKIQAVATTKNGNSLTLYSYCSGIT